MVQLWDEMVYCTNCGKVCTPERYKRPEEVYDMCSRQVWGWRSSCCKDEISIEPVNADKGDRE